MTKKKKIAPLAHTHNATQEGSHKEESTTSVFSISHNAAEPSVNDNAIPHIPKPTKNNVQSPQAQSSDSRAATAVGSTPPTTGSQPAQKTDTSCDSPALQSSTPVSRMRQLHYLWIQLSVVSRAAVHTSSLLVKVSVSHAKEKIQTLFDDEAVDPDIKAENDRRTAVKVRRSLVSFRSAFQSFSTACHALSTLSNDDLARAIEDAQMKDALRKASDTALPSTGDATPSKVPDKEAIKEMLASINAFKKRCIAKFSEKKSVQPAETPVVGSQEAKIVVAEVESVSAESSSVTEGKQHAAVKPAHTAVRKRVNKENLDDAPIVPEADEQAIRELVLNIKTFRQRFLHKHNTAAKSINETPAEQTKEQPAPEPVKEEPTRVLEEPSASPENPEPAKEAPVAPEPEGKEPEESVKEESVSEEPASQKSVTPVAPSDSHVLLNTPDTSVPVSEASESPENKPHRSFNEKRREVQAKVERHLFSPRFKQRAALVISIGVAGVMIWGARHFHWEAEPVKTPAPRTWTEIVASDTLRAVTIRTSYTAFKRKGKWYGHEYDNARRAARALNLKLQITFAPDEAALIDSLFTGAADVAVWPFSYSVVGKHWFLRPTGPKWVDGQCIVSARNIDFSQFRRTTPDTLSTDTLRAYETPYRLTILKGTRQWHVFHDENVRQRFDFSRFVEDLASPDSLTTEQLADSMLAERTDAVMLRCNVAQLVNDCYPGIHISDTIPGSEDSVAWMVTAGADTLRFLLDSVSATVLHQGTPRYKLDARRRYGPIKRFSRYSIHPKMKGGRISSYDEILQKVAAKYHLDWRLLASIAYVESRFNDAAQSPRGALGLMQLMPSVVTAKGFTENDAFDPEINTEIAASLIARLTKMIHSHCPKISHENQICFMLAAYNAGLGHLYDAISLAEYKGMATNVWDGSVSQCFAMKNDPEAVSLGIFKCGSMNGAFTVDYVDHVLYIYRSFCNFIDGKPYAPLEKVKQTDETPTESD